jgi:glycosyltransferase involved in cell wall biosynthesis
MPPFPDFYKTYRLYRVRGRAYAVPPSLNPEWAVETGLLFTHPAVLSAGSLDELRAQIDTADLHIPRSELVCLHAEYRVVRFRGRLHAVPHAAGDVDLDLPDDRRRAGIVSAATEAELNEKLRRRAAAEPVEFAGWLPIYQVSGNCGRHPQFAHIDEPPPGYRFTVSAPPPRRRFPAGTLFLRRFRAKLAAAARGVLSVVRLPFAFFRPCPGVRLRDRVVVFVAMVRMLAYLLGRGCGLRSSLKFLWTRHLQSQLQLGDRRGPVFLTSMPYTFNQSPWVIEIEDPTTLFYPLVQNGHTAALDVRRSPYFPVVKAVLESAECRAILTHMRSTAELVPTLFGSDVIRRKVVYAPIGVTLPARWQRHDPRPADEPIHLLFINSWCQVPENFYVRGGLDVLEAFDVLRERYPQLRLTMRTHLPPLDDHYRRIIERGWVRVIDRFVTADEMAGLHAESHVYLLPAARVHIVSLLQAMAHGLAVVASDGWGIEEYVDDGRNGLVVRGRYGKASWADPAAGQLREDYGAMATPDPDVVAGIVAAVSRLVEDHRLRARLGRTARADVAERFTVDGWNRGLKAAFDLATGRADAPPLVWQEVSVA